MSTSTDDEDENDDNEYWRHKIEETRVYTTPNDTYYGEDTFLTKVKISKMLELGKVSRIKPFQKNDGRKKRLKNIKPKDSIAHSIRHAHQIITNGDFTVQSAETEDPTLEQASEFIFPEEFEMPKRGWARR